MSIKNSGTEPNSTSVLSVSAWLGIRQGILPRIFLTQRRKGAKRCRVFGGFLCAFAPLREKYSCHRCALGLFVALPVSESLSAADADFIEVSQEISRIVVDPVRAGSLQFLATVAARQ